jgi:hypothetical protein
MQAAYGATRCNTLCNTGRSGHWHGLRGTASKRRPRWRRVLIRKREGTIAAAVRAAAAAGSPKVARRTRSPSACRAGCPRAQTLHSATCRAAWQRVAVCCNVVCCNVVCCNVCAATHHGTADCGCSTIRSPRTAANKNVKPCGTHKSKKGSRRGSRRYYSTLGVYGLEYSLLRALGFPVDSAVGAVASAHPVLRWLPLSTEYW